ncbi:MAG: hypothetical protein KME09_05200 [Pleurocapsa minor HA4230-MV1]|jgi:hypothetical protein|nr:hypothetical protein [Pleurocapsa minor HA4230-MV1]
MLNQSVSLLPFFLTINTSGFRAMSPKFEQLTLEQINLIPSYVEKWKKIAFSTEKINRQQAEKIVNSTYEMLGYKPPVILFFDSPYACCDFILGQTVQQSNETFGKHRVRGFNRWKNKFEEQMYSQIDFENIKNLHSQGLFLKLRIFGWSSVDGQVRRHIWEQLDEPSQEKIWEYLGHTLDKRINSITTIANSVCVLDYLITEFNLVLNDEHQNWDTYKSLLGLGNYIFLRDQACIICDRPIDISLDSLNYLHAEGKPAIQFADKTGLYSHHYKTLSIELGKLHPQQWQAKWLLTEKCRSLREALVEGLGYVRICHELSVTELDCWKNYKLIQINISQNSKLYYLLRMNNDHSEIERALEYYNPERLKFSEDYLSVLTVADGMNWDIESEVEGSLKI